jgi:polyisoprenoid-binding protein YceI
MKIKQMIARSAAVAVLALATNWNVDSAAAKIKFSVEGPFGTVHGSFTGLKATVKFDEKDLAGSAISASIDAKTVNSGVGMRNSHLRNEEEWLNTAKYPEISFHSDKIEKAGSGYKATGNLTLKGLSKPVEISFTFTPTGDTGVFKGHFSFKREDYKLGNPGGSVGSVINIELEVPVKK